MLLTMLMLKVQCRGLEIFRELWAGRMVEKGGAAKAGDIVVRIGNSSDS